MVSSTISTDYFVEMQPQSIKIGTIVPFQRAQKGVCSSIICWEQRAAPPVFLSRCSSELYTVRTHVYLVCAGIGFICSCPACYIFQSVLWIPVFSLFMLEDWYVCPNQGGRLLNPSSFLQNKIFHFLAEVIRFKHKWNTTVLPKCIQNFLWKLLPYPVSLSNLGFLPDLAGVELIFVKAAQWCWVLDWWLKCCWQDTSVLATLNVWFWLLGGFRGKKVKMSVSRWNYGQNVL